MAGLSATAALWVPVEAAYSWVFRAAAVRSALTDDGRPPLAAPGRVLKGRLEAVAESLDRVEGNRGGRRN